jgi:hypothetical protein
MYLNTQQGWAPLKYIKLQIQVFWDVTYVDGLVIPDVSKKAVAFRNFSKAPNTSLGSKHWELYFHQISTP